MTRPALLLSLLLTSCAAPRTMDVSVLVHGSDPFVMRDKDACVLVLSRDVSYGQLGAMVRECFRSER